MKQIGENFKNIDNIKCVQWKFIHIIPIKEIPYNIQKAEKTFQRRNLKYTSDD